MTLENELSDENNEKIKIQFGEDTDEVLSEINYFSERLGVDTSKIVPYALKTKSYVKNYYSYSLLETLRSADDLNMRAKAELYHIIISRYIRDVKLEEIADLILVIKEDNNYLISQEALNRISENKEVDRNLFSEENLIGYIYRTKNGEKIILVTGIIKTVYSDQVTRIDYNGLPLAA